MKTILRLISVVILTLSLLISFYAGNRIGVVKEKVPKKQHQIFSASKKLTKILINQSVTVLSINKGNCSGTVIYENKGNHYVLTAKHCIDVTEEMYVEHNKVSYIITSTNDDLAVLVVEGTIPGKNIANLSKSESYIGETIHHIGYPNEVLYKSFGTVVRKSDDWVYYNLKILSGCSGGGVFNTKGELLGVIWGNFPFATKKAPRKSVGEPLYDIEKFLRLVLPEALNVQ